MDMSQFQKESEKTILPQCLRSQYMLLGLVDEVGEVTGKFKKRMRGDEAYQNTEEFLEMIELELGDVLFYIAGLCTALGLDLNEVAEVNIAKLQKRLAEGKIQGDGDKR